MVWKRDAQNILQTQTREAYATRWFNIKYGLEKRGPKYITKTISSNSLFLIIYICSTEFPLELITTKLFNGPRICSTFCSRFCSARKPKTLEQKTLNRNVERMLNKEHWTKYLLSKKGQFCWARSSKTKRNLEPKPWTKYFFVEQKTKWQGRRDLLLFDEQFVEQFVEQK